MKVSVRPAERVDHPAVGELLARAFQDDPVFVWIFPDPELRKKRLLTFYQRSARICADRGGKPGIIDGGGAILWFPPGAYKMGILQQLRYLPVMLQVFGSRLDRAFSFLTKTGPYHPPEPVSYLFAIGADPTRQGQGIGGALLGPMLEQCDDLGLPAHLESSNERNLPFYQRHGFVLTHEVPLAKDGPKIFIMGRPRRGA